MKRLIVLTILCYLLLSGMAVALSAVPSAQAYEDKTEIAHFFTHALIADPDLAFRRDNPMRDAYHADCLTAKEFRGILEALYQKDYVLVDIDTVYQQGKKVKFSCPEGRKPMILSFDDINYYVKKMHLGMNDRLVVADGKIASERDGKIEFDNEVVTIVERFIEEHPDFSHHGARGMLCLTGFDGIFGYRTNAQSRHRAAEIDAVKPVVAALKRDGWRFACHSYGHYHMKSLADARFHLDTSKWKREVEPLVGKTDIYVYPYGEHVVTDERGNLTQKHRSLRKQGFTLFCGVGLQPYYQYFPHTDQQVLFMDRIPLDGLTLRAKKQTLKKYFDFEDVYDTAARAAMANR